MEQPVKRVIVATKTFTVPLNDHLESMLDEMGVDSVDPQEVFDALDMHLDDFESAAAWAWA